MSELLDAAGRRRSPVTLPEFHAGRPPRNKGMRYPADPPTIEEVVTVMRHAAPRPAAGSRALPAAGPRPNHRPRTGWRATRGCSIHREAARQAA
jgi:hypothetical protein